MKASLKVKSWYSVIAMHAGCYTEKSGGRLRIQRLQKECGYIIYEENAIFEIRSSWF